MFPRLFHSLALRAMPFGFSKSTHNEFIVMEKISNAQRHRVEKKKTKVKDWKMLQLLSDWIDGIAKSSAARQLQRLGQCAGRCGLLNTAKFVENATQRETQTNSRLWISGVVALSRAILHGAGDLLTCNWPLDSK